MISDLIATCPHCSSNQTIYKERVKLWECQECDERFDPTKKTLDPQSIFLSYAHKSELVEDFDISEDLVWLIKEALEQDGHSVWIDREGIRGGTHWRERITDAITSHKHFFAFLSRRSVRQDPNVCLNEVAIAIKHNRIIQTILTESENRISAPLTLSSIQWHKFQDWKEIKDGKKKGPQGEDWPTWFENLMVEIRQNLADITFQQKVGELGVLFQILLPSSFTADIINSVEGFFGRKWLFDAYRDWLATDKRIFWLKGSPGIGKSSFAAKLVHDGNSEVVGFFKCNFQGLKSAEESAKECIKTLSYQLASRLPDYRIKLLRGQNLSRDSVKNKSADDLFTYLISEPLNSLEKIAESQRMVLIIDALDEAGRKANGLDVNPLANLIYKHAEKLPRWLGIVVTSRPEAYLQQQLETKYSPHVIDGELPQNITDIEKYLETKLDVEIKGKERERIIAAIVQKGAGTFLYIKRVELNYDLSKPETLPIGIDDVFFRDFQRYFPDPKQYGEMSEKFLRLMVAAPGPLPKLLGKEILQWEDRDVTLNVTQPMQSLLIETEMGIQIYHKSLSEWLLDGSKSGLYQVNKTGSKELGEFLWKEYRKYENDYKQDNNELKSSFGNEIRKSLWHDYIVKWLTGFLPQTRYWSNRIDLIPYSEFLDAHLIIEDECLVVYERQLELTKIECGLDSIDYINSLQKYADALIFYVEVYQKRQEEARQALDKLLEIKIKKYGMNDSKTLETAKELVIILFSLNNYEYAEDLLDNILYLSEKNKNNISMLDKWNYISQIANALVDNDKKEIAEKIVRRLIEIESKSKPESDIDLKLKTIVPFKYLAGLLTNMYRHEEALDIYKNIRDVECKSSANADSQMTLIEMGNLLLYLERFEESKSYLNICFDVQKKENYYNYIFNVNLFLILSEVLINMDEYDSSKELINNSFELIKCNFDINSNNYPSSYSPSVENICENNFNTEFLDPTTIINLLARLGRHLNRLKKYEDAIIFNSKSLEISEMICGPESNKVVTFLNNLGFLFFYFKRFSEAEINFRRVLSIKEKYFGLNNLPVANALDNLGWFLYEIGRYEEAEILLKRAIEIQRFNLTEDDLSLCFTLDGLGCLYQKIKKFELAEPIFLEVFNKRERFLGSNDLLTKESKQRLSDLYEKWEKPELAKNYFILNFELDNN